MSDKTRTDLIIERIKNHRFTAWAIVLGISLVAIGQVLGVYKAALDLWRPEPSLGAPAAAASSQTDECTFVMVDSLRSPSSGVFEVQVDGARAGRIFDGAADVVAVLRGYARGESVPVTVSFSYRRGESGTMILPRRAPDRTTASKLTISDARYVLLSYVDKGPTTDIRLQNVTLEFLQVYADRARFAAQPRCLKGSGVVWWGAATKVDSSGRNIQ
jgi:hypothetical protein